MEPPTLLHALTGIHLHHAIFCATYKEEAVPNMYCIFAIQNLV